MQPKIPKIPMPGKSLLQMQTPLINTSLNPEIFEQQIKSQGLRMIHSRPVPCPNIRDLYNHDHNPACNECYNGFLYYNSVEFTGAFFGNDLQRMFNQNGTWDLDQTNIIIPVQDSANNIIDVQYFDQILIPDFTVRYYQRVEHSQSGIDRLHFPAITADFVVSRGGKKFRPGVDFVIQEGRVKWIGERPGWDASIQKGVIYSINYYTRPVFSVLHLPHHLRMAQTQGNVGENNIQARFPQLAVCRKDFLPYDHTDKTGAPDTPEPSNGSFI